LLSLMDEIFDIAQIESGLMPMHHEPCFVNELLTSVVTFFNLEKSVTGKDDIQIRMRKANKDNSFMIYTDTKKLRQTLFNLVENALKYTKEGSIEIGYQLKDNAMVEFYVRDTGIGFPQERLDVLFQRFRQADDSSTREYGGIGLGLTLSLKFVELFGGEMRAESKEGHGSVFYVSLPYNNQLVVEETLA
jgi:signal transduction histidine kinase